MPHFKIDYSANLETHVDMAGLCQHIRATAAGIETFPMAGIRVRAVRADHYAIADGNTPCNAVPNIQTDAATVGATSTSAV